MKYLSLYRKKKSENKPIVFQVIIPNNPSRISKPKKAAVAVR